MVAIEDRARRIVESGRKILKPYAVDPALCLYSPQDNLDSLAHPDVARWLTFVREEYVPAPTSARRILLFLPCTATKPYAASSEHRAINSRLLAEGFKPVDPDPSLPHELIERLELDDDTDLESLFALGPLRRGDVELHRVVMSEPLAFVPYQHMLRYDGGPCPAIAYDDPGLFENRGNAVSPWRLDSTAEQVSETQWRWGENERRAYVEMHNAMAQAAAHVLTRLAPYYSSTIAWVAPGLTHRSFCLAKSERSHHGVVASKLVGGKRLRLVGVNDFVASESRIEVLPTPAHCAEARRRLEERLAVSPRAANAVYARGGGGATPLALPEMLDVLIERLEASHELENVPQLRE